MFVFFWNLTGPIDIAFIDACLFQNRITIPKKRKKQAGIFSITIKMGRNKNQFRTRLFCHRRRHSRKDAFFSCFIARGSDDASFALVSNRDWLTFQGRVFDPFNLGKKCIEVYMDNVFHFSL